MENFGKSEDLCYPLGSKVIPTPKSAQENTELAAALRSLGFVYDKYVTTVEIAWPSDDADFTIWDHYGPTNGYYAGIYIDSFYYPDSNWGAFSNFQSTNVVCQKQANGNFTLLNTKYIVIKFIF